MSTFQLILPLNTEVLIPEDDSVRLLDQMLDKLDYTSLQNRYSDLGRNPALPPKTFFKVLAYAYMNNIYTTRLIEKACKRDINFMWLLGGKKAPDHNTICRFRTGRLGDIVEELFYQFVGILGKTGEIAYENIFIDGTKIEANANKYSFVWKKSVEKHKAKLKVKIQLLIEEINKTYGTCYTVNEEEAGTAKLAEALEFLKHQQEVLGIEFVYGKGKRKKTIQIHIEKLQEYIATMEKYDSNMRIFAGRNSFSKTDHDATFMHMKDDHMRNSQLKPGYNVQIGVEGEYIVGVDIFCERSDQLTLIPFLEKLNEQLQNRYKNVVADAGYESEENYDYLATNNQKSYIKPANYEITKKGNFSKKVNLRENMQYNEEKDEYTCHNQRILKHVGEKIRKSKSGYESRIKIYECENCTDCEHKPRCTKSKGNRQLNFSVQFTRLREKSLSNIISDEGIRLRVNRSIQVEGAFGVLKEDYGFRRFLSRGKKNVKVEFILLCLAFNINKMHSKKMRNSQGVSMFDIKAA